MIFGHHGVECAARAFGGVPELTAVSGIDVREANGPGLGGGALRAAPARVGRETVTLPLFPAMSDDDVVRVCRELREVLK